MKIAYLMNTYPMTSTTFVRREIEALERLGVTIQRYASRPWSVPLVDPRDQAEAIQTQYLMAANVMALAGASLRELVRNPRGLWRGVTMAWQLAQAARGQRIKHVAYLLQAVFLRQLASRDGIAHIHAHFSTNAAAIALLSRRMGGPSYSFTAHGPDEFDEATRLGFDLKLAGAAFAIAISEFCRSQLLRFGGTQHAGKIKIVHCGVSLDEFVPGGAIAPDNQTFVCVGRLCAAKAQSVIPGAVAKLKTEFPALRVVLVGDGDSRRDIEQAIAANGVAANVELLGWQANSRVRELVRDSRALLLPTFAEGLPVVIMEALALGRPVISTYIAGIPELLDAGCGWIVPAGSEARLAAAMRAALLATPQELARLGAEGRARIEAGFDINAEATRLLAHISDACGGRTKI